MRAVPGLWHYHGGERETISVKPLIRAVLVTTQNAVLVSFGSTKKMASLLGK